MTKPKSSLKRSYINHTDQSPLPFFTLTHIQPLFFFPHSHLASSSHRYSLTHSLPHTINPQPVDTNANLTHQRRTSPPPATPTQSFAPTIANISFHPPSVSPFFPSPFSSTPSPLPSLCLPPLISTL